MLVSTEVAQLLAPTAGRLEAPAAEQPNNLRAAPIGSPVLDELHLHKPAVDECSTHHASECACESTHMVACAHTQTTS